MSFDGFCQPVCFFAARFTLRQPKTPVRNATNLFWRLSTCISRDSLSCETRSLNLCILFKFLFSYLWCIPPHSCAFDTFYFTPIFFMYILPSKIFFLSLMTLLLGISLLFLISAVKGLIWDLSNVLLNVYSFHTMEFSMKHKYKLAHIYQQSFKPCCYCLIKVKA